MERVTVWSVFWGDKYHPGYVYALRDAVAKHLTVPHVFRCITNAKLAGIDTVPEVVPHPGWWQKIGLWSQAGPSLYFDLDVVIVGSLDYLVPFTRFEIAAPANWAQSGYGGIQSSVLAWSGEWRRGITRFDPEYDMPRLHGDQEFLTELRGDRFEKIPRVCSYKYHCRGKDGHPPDSSIVVFHGKPDPHEVNDEWMLPYTRTLRSRIKSDGQVI